MNVIRKVSIASIVVLTAAGMTACSTLKTTVIPQSQNKYTVVATAESGSTAINGAIKKAQNVCTHQGKTLDVISHHTAYKGAGKTLGAVTSMISSAAFLDKNVYVPGTKTAEDYKSTVQFECK